jgi:hypothetical protein
MENRLQSLDEYVCEQKVLEKSENTYKIGDTISYNLALMGGMKPDAEVIKSDLKSGVVKKRRKNMAGTYDYYVEGPNGVNPIWVLNAEVVDNP